MNELDEQVMGDVLANETTCRSMLDYLIARGVEFRPPLIPDKLTHQECIDLILKVHTELLRREKRDE